MSGLTGTDGVRSLGLLSVVAPVYNEDATLEPFYSRVCEALEDVEFELVLVDDGSTDRSASLMAELASGDPRVRVVYLSRNFGHQTALTAGLDHARGDAVVMLDADLQDPPEVIPKMLRFSLDAISSFSHRPLQLATLLGFLISTLAFIAIPVVVILRILGSYLPGFSSVTIAVLLLGGIELIALGIIGEYVGRIYDEVKGRPLYLVRSRLNVPEEETPAPPLPPL